MMMALNLHRYSTLLLVLLSLTWPFLPPVAAWTARSSRIPIRTTTSSTRLPVSSNNNNQNDGVDATSSTNSDNTHQEEIRQTLLQGLQKMEHVMDVPFWHDGNPTLKALYTKTIKTIAVQDSTLSGAGLGLFATKAIKANTIVSWYPAHALGIDDMDPFVTLKEEDAAHFQQHGHATSPYLHCTDQALFQRPSLLQTTRETQPQQPSLPPIYLDVNPNKRIPNAMWVSHRINDGAKLLDATCEEGILDYYRRTKQRKNCIHIPLGPSPMLATITTKKVNKGDELFTSYGATYWLGDELDPTAAFTTITPAIQAEIQTSARDLVQAMTAAQQVYGNHVAALQQAWNDD